MKPSKPEHFIGKTGLIARALFHKVPKLKSEPNLEPLDRCFLFTGDPGIGKTSLAEAFAKALASVDLDIQHINGQSCTVERVRQWTLDGFYRPMGDLRVQIVDEIDAASPAACNELRTYLDKLPPRTVFVATTNQPVKKLQEQLQSRFKVQFFDPIPAKELSAWLVQHYRIAAEWAATIAEKNSGNVRASKADALGIIEMQEAMAT